MRFGLVGTYLAAFAMLAWDEINVEQRVPHPAKFVYASIVWGVLGIVAELGAPELAFVFSIGILLSMAYVYFQSPRRTVNQASMSGSRDITQDARS